MAHISLVPLKGQIMSLWDIYGSYTLEYNCHIPQPQCSRGQKVVFLVYTAGDAFDL